jgi:uncharacterized phiE125 gp8 family phage protein
MAVEIISISGELPITLEEAKEHLNLEHDLKDQEIQMMIESATLEAANYTRRGLIAGVFELKLDGPWADRGRAVDVPLPPLTAVESITYDNTKDQAVVLDAGEYRVDTTSTPGRVEPVSSFPSDVRAAMNAIRIRFRAGWSQVTVPSSIKMWIKVRVADMYEQRESYRVGSIVSEMPRHFHAAMLDAWIIY